jgi:hypothetical protein
MATTSVTTTSQAPVTTSTTTPTTTYLSRCMENLSPEKVANFQGEASKWRTIAIISTVAFFALAIGAFIATSILLPAYLPLAGIGSLLLAFPAAQQVQKFLAWAEEAQKEADKFSLIQREYTDLNAKDPIGLQRELLKMGILWFQIQGMQVQHPERLSELNPLLAHAKYLEGQTKSWIEHRDQHAREAQQAGDDLQKKSQEQRYALRCEDAALTCKIKNAFYHAVLRKPAFAGTFAGTFDGLGALSNNSFEERMLGNGLGETTANNLFTFSNATIAPITHEQAKTMTVAELGQRFFAAMAA